MSKEEKPTRERVVEDREISERRLDAFARLLAAKSECIAVAVIDEKLYATANEFNHSYGKRGGNHVSPSIEAIAKYFQKLDNYAKPDNRGEIFKEICSHERLNIMLKGASIHITNETSDRAAIMVLNHASDQKKTHDVMREEKRNAGSFGFAYGEYTQLYVDFNKLEESIQACGARLLPKIEDDELEVEETLTKEELGAFSKPMVVLDDVECEKGEHAEMQMLNHILATKVAGYLNKNDAEKAEHKQEKIYIGISKLCCLNCGAMIRAADDIFRKNDIPIHLAVRGYHNLSFLKKNEHQRQDKWVCPEIFSEGYSGKKKSKNNNSLEEIAHSIGKSGREKIKELQDLPPPKEAEMLADMSDSDTQSIGDAPRLDHLSKLENQLSVLVNFQKSGLRLDKTLSDLSIAVDLHGVRAFSDLWDSLRKTGDIEMEVEVAEEQFATIQKAYVKLMNIDEVGAATIAGQLLRVLTNPSLVREEMSAFFEKIEKPQSGFSSSLLPLSNSSSLPSSSSGVSSSSSSSSSGVPASSSSSSSSRSSSPSMARLFSRSLPIVAEESAPSHSSSASPHPFSNKRKRDPEKDEGDPSKKPGS